MAKLPTITVTSRAGRFTARHLVAPLQKILAQLQVQTGTWDIVLVRDAEMKSLHHQHLDDPTTTDVLTFDMRDSGSDELQLESVLCIDEARRRAEEMGHKLQEELLLYAVHSLLHVQGYDDVTAAKAARMHRREDELLRAAGVGAIYAKGAGK